MAGRGQQRKNVLLPPINFLFKLLQSRTAVKIWLSENTAVRMEGNIAGFDEFMNIVLEKAVEVKLARGEQDAVRRPLGTILLKGDNITLIQQLDP